MCLYVCLLRLLAASDLYIRATGPGPNQFYTINTIEALIYTAG